jgi:N-acetyl-alpha-D-muramate 1-phosphate uridylyltransferase
MKAMILAAGMGTRLKDLTQDKPKALVEVNGKPLLSHIISKLVNSGFTEIVVNVHHFANKVIDFINQNDFGVTIHISDESNQLLDTGGGILNAKTFLKGKEPFLVHNVDILSDLNLGSLMEIHKQNGGLASLAVSKRESTRKFLFDKRMKLVGWRNISIDSTIIPIPVNKPFYEYAFSGIHIISPEIFNLISKKGAFSIVDVYLTLCTTKNIIGIDVSDNFVIDVGKPESLVIANEFVDKTNL